MGYTTKFKGKFKIDKPLDDETFELLKLIAETRRMKRSGLPEKYGVDGEFYGESDNNEGSQGKIVDYNTPPSTQPGLWCQWLIQEDRQTIEWDRGEKFYKYVEWLEYLIDRILKPRNYIVNGVVKYKGEYSDDSGSIEVKDNEVFLDNVATRALKELSTIIETIKPTQYRVYNIQK